MGATAIYLHPGANSRLNGSVHIYEVRPRKDRRGVNLIRLSRASLRVLISFRLALLATDSGRQKMDRK